MSQKPGVARRVPVIARRVAILGGIVLGGACLSVGGRIASRLHEASHNTHSAQRNPYSAQRGAPASRPAPASYHTSGSYHAPAPLVPASPTAARILAGAKAQIGTIYDASYQTIAYPGGDVQPQKGACTDVIIRALRGAGYDLQSLIHNDMKGARRAYPFYPHQRGLDPNIDHRRVPNQMAYFRRHGQSLPLDTKGAHLKTWQPGDIVAWNLISTGGTLLHTGIVSDARNARGEPFVVHNLSVCAEEDVLTHWQIIGHFRFPASTNTSITRG